MFCLGISPGDLLVLRSDIKSEISGHLLVDMSSALYNGFCCTFRAGLINKTSTHDKIGPKLYFTFLENNLDTPFLQ